MGVVTSFAVRDGKRHKNCGFSIRDSDISVCPVRAFLDEKCVMCPPFELSKPMLYIPVKT